MTLVEKQTAKTDQHRRRKIFLSVTYKNYKKKPNRQFNYFSREIQTALIIMQSNGNFNQIQRDVKEIHNLTFIDGGTNFYK
jgi:hypothetical protein